MGEGGGEAKQGRKTLVVDRRAAVSFLVSVGSLLLGPARAERAEGKGEGDRSRSF